MYPLFRNADNDPQKGESFVFYISKMENKQLSNPSNLAILATTPHHTSSGAPEFGQLTALHRTTHTVRNIFVLGLSVRVLHPLSHVSQRGKKNET